jgi:hypothetical protein
MLIIENEIINTEKAFKTLVARNKSNFFFKIIFISLLDIINQIMKRGKCNTMSILPRRFILSQEALYIKFLDSQSNNSE